MFQNVGQSRNIVIYLTCLCIFPCWLLWWTLHNPLPDGYQNEYLHVGNAYDLWGALRRFDVWHLRWYMYTNYWPWGFYAVGWPALLATGKTVQGLILSNLWYYGLLCWSMHRLAKVFDSPYALLLLLLCPAVFGSMTRFEPNLANISMLSVGLMCLVNSQNLNHRGWTIGWGVALGVGLMLDRLTILFFLGPAVLAYLPEMSRKKMVNLLFASGVGLFITAAYYREFLLRHTEELFSQAPIGEIDSTGELILPDNPIPWLYYPFSLVDNQAGPFVGLVMVVGLALAIWRPQKKDAPLWLTMLPAFVLFTFIAKKQSYYTFPLLVPLALLGGRLPLLSRVGIGGGIVGWLALGVGIGSLGSPFLPEKWVSPRYVLARPPSFQEWPIDDLAQQMTAAEEIVVFSEDVELYEGFLVLKLRRYTDGHVRGVTLDPIGVWEFLDRAEYVVWMTESGEKWPSAGIIEAELISDHYDVAELPDLAQRLESLETEFRKEGEWVSGDGRLMLFRRAR